MSGIHTDIVGDAHAYTRSKSPWRLEEWTEAKPVTSRDMRFGWRLFHYLSGGGMRAMGRTVEQDDQERKQGRFLAVAAAFGAVWLVFWLF